MKKEIIMLTKWMTNPQIALTRGISLDETRGVVEKADYPKLFKGVATYYLL